MDTHLPPDFLQRMKAMLGDEFAAFLASYDQPPITGLRVNELKLGAEAFRQISPFPLEAVPWSPAGFRVIADAPGLSRFTPGKHPYHAAGLYYLQDPSAMAVAEVLRPQPGERVLDLSAAPGGKATHLASLMQNQGLLVANEIHPRRVWELAENLERWGARNVTITNETPERLAEKFGPFFDRVLLDAPCSGEGMFRKSEAARGEWSPGLVQSCALRQANILKEAARLVRPGGLLAYSTCTFAAEENEGALAAFLDEHPWFELVAAPPVPGTEPGRPEWAAEWAGATGSRPELRHSLRLWPHRVQGEGHFIALLRAGALPGAGVVGDTAASERRKATRRSGLPREVAQLWGAFCAEQLPGEMELAETGRLAVSGAYLYRLPEGLPDLTGLRVIHPGWWLGTLKTGRVGRFEPSHALALGVAAPAGPTVSFSHEAPETAAYLRGETVASPGEPGWIRVAVEGFPLGWAKRVEHILKNFYPRGLRQI